MFSVILIEFRSKKACGEVGILRMNGTHRQACVVKGGNRDTCYFSLR